MKSSTSVVSPQADQRLLSLDFFRGLTMFLLIAEFTLLFEHFVDPAAPSWLHHFGEQFHHVEWIGLSFWDLIQPFFMFIVGVAMPFSLGKRQKRGESESSIRNHVFRRSFLMLFLGWWLYCMGAGEIVFKFQNVLAQLAVTYLLAYMVMNKSFKTQLIFSVALIIGSDLIYRFFGVEGFNAPFTPNENFGTWLDLQYGGADMGGHWVSFNAIPTAAHTIWGLMAGQLLLSQKSANEKLKMLLIAGAIGLVAGYALSPVIPIIKRICTSSFILVSGGWTFLALAFSYWLIDIKKWTSAVWIFAIVGMNPLFIYLFAHIGGADLMKTVVSPFTTSMLGWMGEWPMKTIACLITLYILWYLCYWLYKRKIFIRI